MATDIIARGMAAQALKQGGGGSSGESNVYQVKHTDIEFHRQSGDGVEDYRATISLELRSAIGANKDLLFYTEDLDNNLLGNYHFSGNRIYLKCLGSNTYAVYNKLVHLDTAVITDLLFTLYYENNDVIFSRNEYPYTKGSVQGNLEYKEGFSESFEVFSSNIGATESVITLAYEDTDNVITNLDENKPLAFALGGMTTVVVDMDSNFYLGSAPLLTKKTIDNFKVGTDPETGAGLYAFRGTLLEYVVGQEPAVLFVLFPNKTRGSSGESDYILETEFDSVDSETTTTRFYIKALVPNEERTINFMVKFTNKELADLGLQVTVSNLEDIINLANQYKDTLGPVIAGNVLMYGVARVLSGTTYTDGVPGDESVFPVGARFYFEDNSDTNTWDLLFNPNPGVPDYIIKLHLAEFEGTVYNITKSNLVSLKLSKSTTASGGNEGSSADSNNAYKIVFSAEKDETYTDTNDTTQTASLKRDFEIIILKNQEQEIVSQVNSAMQTNFTSINEIAQMINQQISTLGNTDSNVLQLYGQAIYVSSSLTKILIDFSYDYIDATFVESQRRGATLKEIYDLLGLYPLFTGQAFTRVSNVVVSDYSFGGGSSTSESYYKIVLEDEDIDVPYVRLYAFITPSKFSELLTAINTAMGTSLSTPTDVITLYDTLKSDTSDNFTSLKQVFQLVLSYAKQDNGRTICEYDFNGVKVENEIISSMGFMANSDENNKGLQSCFTNTINGSMGVGGAIAFTSSSTLTITEQTNQKI